MEISRLSGDMKYVEINGVTINLEERSRIDLACMQLSSDINQGSIYFWGKIRGTTMDYFVVYTLTQKMRDQDPTKPVQANLPCKNFYWCSSQNFVFSSLPTVKADQAR